MGAFYNFIEDKSVKLVDAEAAGRGIDTPDHAATVAKGSLGIFHGMKSLFLQNEYGQIDLFTQFPQVLTTQVSDLSTHILTLSAERSMLT